MDKCHDERHIILVLADLNKKTYCKGCGLYYEECQDVNIIAIGCGQEQDKKLIAITNVGCFQNNRGQIYKKATDSNLLKIISRIKSEKLRAIIKDIIKTGRKDFTHKDFNEEE